MRKLYLGMPIFDHTLLNGINTNSASIHFRGVGVGENSVPHDFCRAEVFIGLTDAKISLDAFWAYSSVHSINPFVNASCHL